MSDCFPSRVVCILARIVNEMCCRLEYRSTGAVVVGEGLLTESGVEMGRFCISKVKSFPDAEKEMNKDINKT